MRLALDCALTERGFHSGVPAHKPDTRLQWKFYAVAFAFLIVSDENAWKSGTKTASHSTGGFRSRAHGNFH